jgi:hypothetical protein
VGGVGGARVTFCFAVCVWRVCLSGGEAGGGGAKHEAWWDNVPRQAARLPAVAAADGNSATWAAGPGSSATPAHRCCCRRCVQAD